MINKIAATVADALAGVKDGAHSSRGWGSIRTGRAA